MLIVVLFVIFAKSAGAEVQCPPPQPIIDLSIDEVPESILRTLVDNGGLLIEDKKLVTLIAVVGERVEGYVHTDEKGEKILFVGVFARVSQSKTFDAMGPAECTYVAVQRTLPDDTH